MKICPKCKEEKRITEFHKDRSKSSGFRSHCTTCTNIKSKNFREQNPEYMRNWLVKNEGYHKKWGGVYGEYGRLYAKANRDKIRLNRERYNNKWPEKVLSRYIYVAALKRGDIIKQPCETCGDIKVDGHHENYNEPLEIIWLCRKHHQERHAELKRININI